MHISSCVIIIIVSKNQFDKNKNNYIYIIYHNNYYIFSIFLLSVFISSTEFYYC